MLFSIWYVFGMAGNEFSQHLSEKDLISPSLMKLSLASYAVLGWNFISSRLLNIDPQSLLAHKVSSEKSAVSLLSFPL